MSSKTLKDLENKLNKKVYECLRIVGTAIVPMTAESLDDKKIRIKIRDLLNDGLRSIEILEDLKDE